MMGHVRGGKESQDYMEQKGSSSSSSSSLSSPLPFAGGSPLLSASATAGSSAGLCFGVYDSGIGIVW